jgi:hypothetical protein
MRGRAEAARGRGRTAPFAAALVGLACLAGAHRAAAFCRTTTCPLPADWNPSGGCEPTSTFIDGNGQEWPDFTTYCASLNPPARVFPLWWRNSCVSYDVLQEDGSADGKVLASVGHGYAAIAPLVDQAFAQWTSTACVGGGNVSISAQNLGPVQCDMVQYNPDQGNQHVIILRLKWPYDTPGSPSGAISANTLGLTTVTFDADSGEIFDADTEINANVPLSTSDTVPPGSFDLASIITHEMGHFLGLAHSNSTDATMYARYSPGSISMRTLTSDDQAGLCAIYPPVGPGAAEGTRDVDPAVSASGVITADRCDPTPRHGFTTVCAQPLKRACATANEGSSAPAGATPLFVVGATALAAARRRRRA